MTLAVFNLQTHLALIEWTSRLVYWHAVFKVIGRTVSPPQLGLSVRAATDDDGV